MEEKNRRSSVIVFRLLGAVVGCCLVVSTAFAQFTSSGGNTTTTDNVNIGANTAPEAKLDINSSTAWRDGFGNALRLAGSAPSLRLFDSGQSKSALIGYSNGELWIGLGYPAAGGTGNYVVNLHGAGGADIHGGLNVPDGNVGIGAAPTASTPLEIFPSLAEKAIDIHALSGGPAARSRLALGTRRADGNWGSYIDGWSNYASALGTQLILGTTNAAGTRTDAVAIDASQNVGVGGTPTTRLDVYGNQAWRNNVAAVDEKVWAIDYGPGNWFSLRAMNDQWSDASAAFTITRSGKNITSMFFPNGNVGIGMTAPGDKLSIVQTQTAATLVAPSAVRIANNQGAGNFTNVHFAGLVSDGWIGHLDHNVSSVHRVSISASTAEDLVVLGNGNVGIGTTTPVAKLDVGGNINASGAITGGLIHAKYRDVAEWVPSTQQLPPGTVVVLDSSRRDHVTPSSEAYDTTVAGVVSPEPGIILGEPSSDKSLVATTGRVTIRVTASDGPIRIGDLLVTSNVPGTAMRSEPIIVNGRKFHQPGTILGKALEPLQDGTGQILVLLTLQ